MAVKRGLYFRDAPLRAKARPVGNFGGKLERLVEDLVDTLRAYEGVGLAAPQVGVSKRVFVLTEPEGEPMCFINPEMREREGRAAAGAVGVPGVTRAQLADEVHPRHAQDGPAGLLVGVDVQENVDPPLEPLYVDGPPEVDQ